MDSYIISIHLGAVKTGLQSNWPGVSGILLRLVASLFFKSPSEGAEILIYCATQNLTPEGMFFISYQYTT